MNLLTAGFELSCLINLSKYK